MEDKRARTRRDSTEPRDRRAPSLSSSLPLFSHRSERKRRERERGKKRKEKEDERKSRVDFLLFFPQGFCASRRGK
jgi:hypothetical protein